MKSKKLLLGLTVGLMMGLGITTFAADTGDKTTTNNTEYTCNRNNGVGLRHITGQRGYDYIQAVLKDKLGMTDEQITNGINSGKTLYDLAEEKGMTEDQFRAAILEEKNKAIDAEVSDGKISAEEGNSLKETIKNNSDNCTITPGSRAHNGIRGNGFGNCSTGCNVE